MCLVSLVAEHYGDKWRFTAPLPMQTITVPYNGTVTLAPVDRAEFDALKREVEDLKALLKRAKQYDEDTGQPDCKKGEKVELVRKIAEFVGVDLDDVLGPGR